MAVAGDRSYSTITAGYAHTCALDPAGKAWCWGLDRSGQVGDGSAEWIDKFAPVAVTGDRSYATLTGGCAHTCAVDTAGKAWCWGDDNDGQVGDGSADQSNKYAPVSVSGGLAFKSP